LRQLTNGLAALIVLPELARADDPALAAGSQLWLVSSRGLTSEASRVNLQDPRLQVRRWQSGGWTSASVEELTQADAELPLIVYVHGNRYTEGDAISRGRTIFNTALRFRMPGRPLHWVIWSWPSEKVSFGVHDVRLKADRADAQSLYLGWLLQQLPQQRRLGLVGYSFGGRVATGALHALAGGAIARRRLPGGESLRDPARMVLIAPAIDNDWLGSGHYHGRAGRLLERVNVLRNSADPMLQRYGWINLQRHPAAMGFTGLRLRPRGLDGAEVPVEQQDVANVVGRSHDELRYFQGCIPARQALAQLMEL
jgi:hypothetical protein